MYLIHKEPLGIIFSVCEYYVHVECQDFAVADCKENATYVPGKQLIQVHHQHHWREGNLPRDSKCALCKKNCYTTECLSGFRCEWCGMTVSKRDNSKQHFSYRVIDSRVMLRATWTSTANALSGFWSTSICRRMQLAFQELRYLWRQSSESPLGERKLCLVSIQSFTSLVILF